MFNVNGTEFLIIAALALLVLGPERMPEMVRKAGKLVAELRRMSAGFQSEMRDAFGEPLDAINEVRSGLNSTVTDLRSTLTNAITSVTSDDSKIPSGATADEVISAIPPVEGEPSASPGAGTSAWGAPTGVPSPSPLPPPAPTEAIVLPELPPTPPSNADGVDRV